MLVQLPTHTWTGRCCCRPTTPLQSSSARPSCAMCLPSCTHPSTPSKTSVAGAFAAHLQSYFEGTSIPFWSDCPKGCRCASMQEELQANTCAQRATLVLSVHNAVCPLLSAVWQGQLAPKVVLSAKRAAGSTCEAVWKVHWLQLAHWLTWAH